MMSVTRQFLTIFIHHGVTKNYKKQYKDIAHLQRCAAANTVHNVPFYTDVTSFMLVPMLRAVKCYHVDLCDVDGLR